MDSIIQLLDKLISLSRHADRLTTLVLAVVVLILAINLVKGGFA